jgi:hypothetical protein
VRKILAIACTTALFVAPGIASAAAKQGNGQAHQDAVKTCKELRKAAGKKGFQDLYGKKGLGRCIKQETRENASEQQQGDETAQKNAAKECKAERDADRQAFNQKYKNLGQCVSERSRQHQQEQQQQAQQQDQAEKNAAKKCKAERKNDPEGFAQRYGTRRNAFGKCVSRNANGSAGQYTEQS